jgi:hypothetical protein
MATTTAPTIPQKLIPLLFSLLLLNGCPQFGQNSACLDTLFPQDGHALKLIRLPLFVFSHFQINEISSQMDQ